MKSLCAVALIALLGVATGCASDLADEPPPLSDVEEPLPLKEEPSDEAARKELPKGGFTGLYVTDARLSLDEMGDAGNGVRVETVVENSPAAAAGIRPGDIILDIAKNGGPSTELHWVSEWRKFELESKSGDSLKVVIDRAGEGHEATIAVEDRLAAPERTKIAYYREEKHLGFAARTATEVEARTAGLGPGGGAVIVGLSKKSPLRAAGVEFGDLLTSVDKSPLSHPQMLIDAVAQREAGDRLELGIVRGGAVQTVSVVLSERESEMQGFSIPGLISYEENGESSDFSFLLGFLGFESTPAAWRFKLFWLLNFKGGENDQLEEVAP